MKNKLSSLSFTLVLFALGLHQLIYLYDWMQLCAGCVRFFLFSPHADISEAISNAQSPTQPLSL